MLKNKSMIVNRIDYYGLVIPALVLIIWLLVTAKGMVASYLLPAPKHLALVGMDFIFGEWRLTPYSGSFWAHSTASLSRVLRGFLLAASIGIPLGLLSGRSLIIKRIFEPTINMLRAIPGIGWLPVAMVWFGVGEKTTLFLIALAAFFPIFINAAQGAANVPQLYIKAGLMLGANKFTLFTTVILPAAFNSLVAGLRLGLGISWAYVVLGELTGVNTGMGATMMDARMLGHVDIVMVTMIFIAILGWFSDKILLWLLRFLPFYGRSE